MAKTGRADINRFCDRGHIRRAYGCIWLPGSRLDSDRKDAEVRELDLMETFDTVVLREHQSPGQCSGLGSGLGQLNVLDPNGS